MYSVSWVHIIVKPTEASSPQCEGGSEVRLKRLPNFDPVPQSHYDILVRNIAKPSGKAKPHAFSMDGRMERE